MLEKLLGNLKQSLPESLRKKMGAEETQDEDSSEHSDEESEESHDTSAKEVSPEDKKKKQISTLIRVVAVIALGYMVVTEFVFKPDATNEVPTVVTKARRPRKGPKKVAKPGDEKTADAKVPDATKPADQPADKPADKTAETKTVDANTTDATSEVKTAANAEAIVETKEEAKEEAKPVEPPKAEAPAVQPPVENINIADKKAEETKLAEKPAEEKKADEEEKAIDETPIVKTGEVIKSPVDKSLDSLIDNMEGEKNSEATPKKSTLEDKIVADDVYTPPPAYDQLGRGLVYNCKDKYWVCLDKAAYVACNKNMKWNSSHGKPTECVVQNVYNSDEDCNTVQKYNVSMSKPTTFCK